MMTLLTIKETKFTNQIRIRMDNISIKAIRFAIYKYQDGIIEIKDLLTKIEEILNEYN